MEDEFLSPSSSNDSEIPLTKQMEQKPASDALSGMTEKEMQQHLEHCMKLAAENKINMKNAFGLHLISIMQNLVKQKESTDLTLASLSLQASSKIYASRIEALYKETYQFHGHLQTIVVGGKSANSNMPADFDDDMNSDEAVERKPQKKKLKSYLCSEDSITLTNTQGNSFTTMPHGNFELIKSAFSTARTAKRLLDSLPLECDSCKINCATSSKCFKPKESPPEAVKFHLSKQIKGKLTGIENLNIKSTEFDDIESANKTMDVFPDAADPWDGGNDTSIADNSNHAVDVMIDRFSILDITADIFARDISQAITKGNEIDERLLPPQSALKRVLRTVEKKPRIVGDEKKKREKKPREPFFTMDQVVDNSLFLPGKKINLTNATINEWCLAETTELCTGHETLFSELITDDESDKKNSGEKVKAFYTVITEMEPQYCLKNYFFKRPALWKRCRRLHSPLKSPFSLASNMRPSSFGMLRNPEIDHNASFENEEGIVQSFRDLSLHDSFENNHCDDGPIDLPSPAKSDEPLSMINNRSGFLEEDIQMMMVTPPELVKPLNVRYNQKPLNIDSDRLKTCMWSVISANLTQNSTKSVLFSEVHKEVQKRYKPDKHEIIPQQLSFVILLILANLKELFLENTEGDKDIIIRLDISDSTSERIEIY
ncbi:uncharacterized protein LOC129967399 [Argiope bruennichi]|uniref:uncharacterized protein LOC129967399 n=1 Tax=Argiope bruennichi TaxID=94029 RepID=UPI002495216A|nr:uncharacterized protein LOC129967399 [Argiope bruennichi]